MSQKEIELKFKINEQTKNKIVEYLDQKELTPSITHMVDTYYIPAFKDFEINGETMECLRIREKNNKNVLCYKKIHRECNPVYCDEYELEVSDKSQMENVLFALGFSIQMIIDKTRYSYTLENYKFEIDYVVDLGYLLEVELIDNTNTDQDIKYILELLKDFNLSKKDINYEGIQVLMKKAKNII